MVFAMATTETPLPFMSLIPQEHMTPNNAIGINTQTIKINVTIMANWMILQSLRIATFSTQFTKKSITTSPPFNC